MTPWEASAERTTTGMAAVAGSALSSLSTWSPCRSGRCRSSRMMSGMSRTARVEAGPAGCLTDLQPRVRPALQEPGDHLDVRRVVLDVEDADGWLQPGRTARPPATLARWPGAGTWITSGARGRLTVKADPSPRTLDAVSWPPMASVRALARGSPIPVPSIAVCSAPSRSKGMKMRSMFSWRHARSGVGDHDAGLAGALFLAGDRDGAAAVVVLDGVGDQVHQDLGEPLPVGVDRQGRMRAVLDDPYRAFGGERGHELAGLLDERTDRDRLDGEAEVTRFDAGDVDELVDEGEQMAPGAEDPLDAVMVFVAEVGHLAGAG